jgi:trypsin
MNSKSRCGFRTIAAVMLWAAPALAIEPAKILTDPALRPWAATVWVGGKHECSASLIDPHWVLTARHCVPSYCGKQGKEVGLAVEVRVPDRPPFPAQAVVCPKVQGGGLIPNDVALVLVQYVKDVDDKLPALSQISLVNLPDTTAASASPMIAVGWAKGDGTRSEAHWLWLAPLPRKTCLALLANAATCPEKLPLGPSQFCAWAAKPPAVFYGLQRGDSGGEIFRRTAARPRVMGVASAACSTGLAIYEDVFHYRKWAVAQACGFYQSADLRAHCLQRLP